MVAAKGNSALITDTCIDFLRVRHKELEQAIRGASLIVFALPSSVFREQAGRAGKFITGEVLTVDGGQQMWGDPWPPGRPDYFKIGNPSSD